MDNVRKSEIINKLNVLLSMDEEGEKLAQILNEMLIDPRKRDVLLVRLNQIKKDLSTLGQEIKLSKTEEGVRSVVLGSKKPLTAQEVTTAVGDEYRSLRHISHASTVLNTLVSKGVLGRFKFGYNYYFTNPREAVSEQLKRRGETPEKCSPADVADETGMPLDVVLNAIEELLS